MSSVALCGNSHMNKMKWGLGFTERRHTVDNTAFKDHSTKMFQLCDIRPVTVGLSGRVVSCSSCWTLICREALMRIRRQRKSKPDQILCVQRNRLVSSNSQLHTDWTTHVSTTRTVRLRVDMLEPWTSSCSNSVCSYTNQFPTMLCCCKMSIII